MSLESAYYTIENLVKDFQSNEKIYISHEYSEAEARKDFIDKFFIALGWDVNHDIQKNPYEQEVKVEKGIFIGKGKKRADYSFSISPQFNEPKFLVEAKKPSISLRLQDNYFQAVKYGWNSKNPLVVLTDFYELHILDSRYKPILSQILSHNYKSYHYKDYLNKEKFQEIYYLFSREAVIEGSIEKRAKEMPVRHGAMQKELFKISFKTVDESFLDELDEIRNSLAHSFKKTNPNLTSEILTEVTQRTIDRLVFLRFLEDKLIEGENHINNYGGRNEAWIDFINDCKGLSSKYNGIVFNPHKIDTTNFKPPENKIFANICEEISDKNSVYDFNQIPVHILGSIYERFLGKIVHATDKRVTIEEKPEVRKAGGVYYTPQYIVKYIVDNTVGKIIEGLTPSQISKLRFADISCGSGSFLITVFEKLLEYHGKYYQNNQKEAIKDGCLLKESHWILSLNQKRNILINNIYGVDIDYQAVEVTQLSLFLKLLEDETLSSTNDMQVLFKEKILPDLSKNIKCGNSLIGTDILNNIDSGIDEEKIRPMDFETAFPEVMKNGGFNAIVGNPPYVVVKGGRYTEFEESKSIINYYKDSFSTLQQQINVYVAFLEISLAKIKQNGLMGLIIPNTFITNDYCEDIRKYFLEKSNIKIIFNEGLVFKNAVVEALVFICEKSEPNNANIIQTKYLNNINEVNQEFLGKIFHSRFLIHLTNEKITIIKKLNKNSIKLFNICEVWRGLTTGNDNEYLRNEKLDNNHKIIIQGKQIFRYFIEPKELYVNYLPSKLDRPRPKEIFEKEEKLISRFVGKDLSFSYDNKKLYVINTGCVIFSKDSSKYNIKYILGILNSNLINFYFKEIFTDYRDTFPIIKSGHLEQLPIEKINFKNEQEKFQHDKMVLHVEQMLESKNKLHEATTERQKTYYEDKCNDLDRQIDELVYDLYGITEEERKVIEGK